MTRLQAFKINWMDIFSRWNFLFSLIYVSSLLSLTVWVQRCEEMAKVLSQATASQHSCMSQDELGLLWVAQLYLDGNWVHSAGSGQMFVFIYPNPVYWIRLMHAVCVCQQINKIKVMPWLEPQYGVLFFSRSVTMKLSTLRLHIYHMLRCTQLFIISGRLNCKHAISSIIAGLNLFDLMSYSLFVHFLTKDETINSGCK